MERRWLFSGNDGDINIDVAQVIVAPPPRVSEGITVDLPHKLVDVSSLYEGPKVKEQVLRLAAETMFIIFETRSTTMFQYSQF